MRPRNASRPASWASHTPPLRSPTSAARVWAARDEAKPVCRVAILTQAKVGLLVGLPTSFPTAVTMRGQTQTTVPGPAGQPVATCQATTCPAVQAA
jgi:hypothetical protein